MSFAVSWLLPMPLSFERNKAEMMKSVETADKRQADRRKVMGAGKEWQRPTGTEEGKKKCLSFKAQVKLVCRKLRWRGGDSDRCSMCWCLKRDHRVKILRKHTLLAHRHTYTHTHTRTSGAFLKAKEIKCGKKGGKKRHRTYFPSNKCHRRHSAYFFFCLQGPQRTLGNEHMSYWPQPLDSIMERFIEVKAKSQPVYSKGYCIVDLFLGSVRERDRWYC